MKKLFLHVGHGKTGSSFIQSIFALSSEKLKENNIIYPEVNNLNRAAQGKITSGNGSSLITLLAAGKNIQDIGGLNYLFSSEVLFHDMLNDKSDYLLSSLNKQDFECIEILLFIRDPIDHASSSYQQSIKRGGGTKSIDDFFATYSQPKLVHEFIQKVNAYDKVNLTIRNYSNRKDDLVVMVANWLNIESSSLMLPKIENINRSLTRAELFLQKEFNQHFGRSGNLIADPLCEELPKIKSESIRPDEKVQLNMLSRLYQEIEEVNAILDENQDKYSRVALNETQHSCKEVIFEKSQIKVFVRSIARELKKSSQKSVGFNNSSTLKTSVQKKFQQDPADVFRNMAIAFEHTGDFEMAYKFMLEANKVRPNGKVIRNKLELYKQKIKS